MTEHKEGHRKSAAHSARHLARVFVMLGLYQWLADPSQDYAGIEAHLSSLLHDEEEQLEGSDIRPTDFEKADRELFTKLLAGVLDRHAEVADAIAKKLGLELQVDDMDFDAALLAAQNGKSDMVMAGVTVTDERQKVMDFSDTYAEGIQSIIVPEDSDIASASRTPFSSLSRAKFVPKRRLRRAPDESVSD